MFENDDIVGQHFYINNCLGAFYKGMLNWFGDEFYPRTNYKVMGSYEKSVEFFNKKRSNSREIDTNILPSITLDPSYDFEPDEQGGRFLWQHENLAPGLASGLFDSYEGLENQCIKLTPIFSRYKGRFDLIFWLNSIYELLDVRVYLFQWSGGYNRRLRPIHIDSFIILPNAINEYLINDETPIDWSGSDRLLRKIASTNQDYYTLPITLTPQLYFESITDGSNKYGQDAVAEYKLIATMAYEINIPTYMVMSPNYGVKKINLNIRMDSIYSKYGPNPIIDPVTNELTRDKEGAPANLVSGSDEEVSLGGIRQLDRRAFYEFTEQDQNDYDPEQNDGFFSFINPLTPDNDEVNVKLYTYTGLLNFGQDWRFNEDKTRIEIKVQPKNNEIVEIYQYHQD